ncbi:MAG: hypothetical protein NTY61_03770, partial [Candidatus Parcubacteria bacterium]|nr:hypothetical protein [Candidatus Parcubacteria bacterium]
MFNKPICPKCRAVLTIKKDYGFCGVFCNNCQISGKPAMTEKFALAIFYREHGFPAEELVSLAKIEDDGGPGTTTMVWRIEHGRYPDAKKKGRKWMLPATTAEKVVVEWKQREGMVLLAEVAVQCGLHRQSLDLQATNGTVRATKVGNKWYVSNEERERLREYYLGTVTSTEAARILGYSHRSYIHKLDLPHHCLKSELR